MLTINYDFIHQIIREAKRTSPCIIYMPHIHQWWASLTDACRSTFLTLLNDIPPESPILVVATAEVQYKYLDQEVCVVHL
jgi:SpoVK/Ycf46/Vps4 family AAA+-type ATPase